MSQDDENLSEGRTWSKSQIHDYIEQAKRLVQDEEEPYRTAAFQVILSHLISGEKSTTTTQRSSEEQPSGTSGKIAVPEEMIDYISGLGDPDKIPVLWSKSDKEWMKVDDFLAAAADAGMTIAKSWSPKQGGNFNNRLYRERKLFVKKGEGKDATYKLSAEGKQKVRELLESSEIKS
jgi:hypothetical protein